MQENRADRSWFFAVLYLSVEKVERGRTLKL
jgi:hypothetical protein